MDGIKKKINSSELRGTCIIHVRTHTHTLCPYVVVHFSYRAVMALTAVDTFIRIPGLHLIPIQWSIFHTWQDLYVTRSWHLLGYALYHPSVGQYICYNIYRLSRCTRIYLKYSTSVLSVFLCDIHDINSLNFLLITIFMCSLSSRS